MSQNLQKSAIITEITMLTHFCTIFFFATKYISKNNNTLCIISSALQRCVIFFSKSYFFICHDNNFEFSFLIFIFCSSNKVFFHFLRQILWTLAFGKQVIQPISQVKNGKNQRKNKSRYDIYTFGARRKFCQRTSHSAALN